MTIPVPMDEELRLAQPEMTRAERQLAAHILSNYPVAALGSITALARAAQVSSPTVVRMVQKLGYKGYPDFQRALRGQIETLLTAPLTKPARAFDLAQGHILPRFASAVVDNINATAAAIDPATFDAVAGLLADPSRRILSLGGRITHAIADYFVALMKVIRPDVLLLSDMSNAWPPAMLDLRAGDVVLIFDIRRYENIVLQAAEMAQAQGAVVVLITDRWISPAAAHAAHVLPCQIEAPSAWDSTITLMLLVESLLAAVQALTWDVTAPRMKRLEDLFTQTRLFRRYR